MSQRSWLWKFLSLLIVVSITGSQTLITFAQTADDTPVITDAAADDEAVADDEESAESPVVADKSLEATGESSSIDTGKNYMYLPLIQGTGMEDVSAAAVSAKAKYTTVFYDEFCSFPSGWGRRDYNGTGDFWVYRTIDGYCAVQPSRYVNTMNTFMTRTFSLVKAKDAYIEFGFKMQAEPYYDYFVTEYSCDNGITWHGSPSSRSNPPSGWVIRKLSLKGSSCLKKPEVTVRFGFTTDSSVTGPIAPAIDYVWVLKK